MKGLALLLLFGAEILWRRLCPPWSTTSAGTGELACPLSDFGTGPRCSVAALRAPEMALSHVIFTLGSLRRGPQLMTPGVSRTVRTGDSSRSVCYYFYLFFFFFFVRSPLGLRGVAFMAVLSFIV